MTFDRIDRLIRSAERLSAQQQNPADAAESSSYFVNYTVVTLYAELENRLNILMARRLERVTDVQARSFALKNARCGSPVNQYEEDRRAGRIKIGELSAKLADFGQHYKDAFNNALTDQLIHSWDSILQARQNVAHHQRGTQMTLADVLFYYKDCCSVVEVFGKALELTELDMSDLI